ncbi:MAG: endopeptidase La [Stomatobaculum sp.]|nr:endopeptidase La [Stomatobaculum sp.]
MRSRKKVPVVALRGLVVLPGRVEHFDVSRRKSMAALEDAMLHYQKVLLVTQKNPDDLDPGADGLFEYGTLCEIRQMARLPKENGRVMVEGVERVRITSVIPTADMLKGEYVSEPLIETDPEAPVAVAMVRVLRDRLNQYARGNRAFFDKYLQPLLRITDVNRLLVRTAADMNWEWQTAQALLECDTADELYSMLVKELTREISVNEIRREFQEKLKGNLDKNQRDYVLREQMKLLRQELGDDTTLTDADEFSEQVEQLEASEEVKTRIRKEISRLKSMPGGSQEGNVVRTYLETLLDLPWDHCSVDNKDLKHAEDVLNEDHYGLEKVKERVLEYLAVRLLNPDSKAPILCLVGPPGTGKTSIAKSVARALDRQYVRISLGGVRDEAEIRGHRKTYVGAMPGRIVEGLRQAGTANPLMLLDEVDKVSSEYRGATASALLEVLDGEQNVRFRDHYVELPIDLSRVLFIATANTLETIPGPLLDRMEIIEVTSYTENEKFHIAKDYLVAKQQKMNGIPEDKVVITDDALRGMIRGWTREAGVRNAERRIGDIFRKCAREILNGRKRKIRIDVKDLQKYLGREKVRPEEEAGAPEIGLVRGLAWTAVGGCTLEIEVNVMPGKGSLQLTGKMGDVMKESGQAALSCVRAICGGWDVKPEFFENHDLHLHIPEGAVPKDGPSAGVTMAVALLSAVAGIPVRADVAMTGEITLRGRVLPVGGLKEKILAAKNARMKTVLVPEKNREEIAEMSEEITGGLNIVYLETVRDALREALAEYPEGRPAAKEEEKKEPVKKNGTAKRRKKEPEAE